MACTCGLWPKDIGWDTQPMWMLQLASRCFQLSLKMTLNDVHSHSLTHVLGRPFLLMFQSLLGSPHMPFLQASVTHFHDDFRRDSRGYAFPRWWASWWYLPPVFSTPDVEDSGLKTAIWSLMGLFYIFLCNFAYLVAYNEKTENFKLREGACPSQWQVRSHINM